MPLELNIQGSTDAAVIYGVQAALERHYKPEPGRGWRGGYSKTRERADRAKANRQASIIVPAVLRVLRTSEGHSRNLVHQDARYAAQCAVRYQAGMVPSWLWAAIIKAIVCALIDWYFSTASSNWRAARRSA